MNKPQTLKGFRDFLPQEAKKRQYAIDTLKQVFSLYGFEPLETPALEYEEILMGKYGTEGDKLMYRFEDNGGRRVALRYDQTVPLARVVAQYGSAISPQGQPVLPLPFKRYQIQPVWRAENTQKGRFREFLQCDIDIVGTNSNAADAEILTVVAKAIEKLGFTDYTILLNDRKIFEDLPTEAIITIDKLKKIGEENVIEELKTKGFDKEVFEKIKNAEIPENLHSVMKIAKSMGLNNKKVKFEPTLARGLDYYTGMIIEVELGGYSAGSVVGGGRYDNLIGMFSPSTGSGQVNKQIPAVGVAFGFDRIIDAMEEKNLFPPSLSSTKVLVTVFNVDLGDIATETANKLRNAAIPTELWLDANAKMEKQLKYADQKSIPYVLIIGPEEKEKNIVTLKDMKTREQKQITVDEIISTISSI